MQWSSLEMEKCGTNAALLDSWMRKKKTNTEIFLLLSNATQPSNAPLGVCPCFYWKTQAQKFFLKRMCLQRVYKHVRRLFFCLLLLVLSLNVWSTLKCLHIIPLAPKPNLRTYIMVFNKILLKRKISSNLKPYQY